MTKPPPMPEFDVPLAPPPDGRAATVWWEWLQSFVRWGEAGFTKLAEPPSDDGEYVRVNGVWRLKSQSADLGGRNFYDMLVPDWGPRMARLTVNVFPSMIQDTGLRLSTDGTTYPAGASDYATAGFFHGSGAAAPGIAMAVEAIRPHFLMTVSPDLATLPARVQGLVGLTRPTAGSYFTYHGHGSSLVTAATVRLANNFIQGWSAAAGYGTALTLKGLRIFPTAGTWLPGSSSTVEWLA
jgi:hypothetical protein